MGEHTFDQPQSSGAPRLAAVELAEQILEHVCAATCDWPAVGALAKALSELADVSSHVPTA